MADIVGEQPAMATHPQIDDGEPAKPIPPAIKTMVFRSLKRTHDMFLYDHSKPVPDSEEGVLAKVKCKISDEYEQVQNIEPPTAVPRPAPVATEVTGELYKAPSEIVDMEVAGPHGYPSAPGVQLTASTAAAAGPPRGSAVAQAVESMLGPAGTVPQSAVAVYKGQNKQIVMSGSGQPGNTKSSSALMPRAPPTVPKPQWHAPWKLYRVIAGHGGWVRCLAFDPKNQWFVTGSNDRILKVWDLASGTLKVSLTGHISHVRAVAVSDRHPYLFSAGEDKQIKCWDLEVNKVIRHYHGHLSAVYDLALHPTLDILATASRDATARVWDMRTKACIHTLTGHQGAVSAVKVQAANPQIVTCSMDSTVRLWDLAAGRSLVTLTNHKKSVRAAVCHPTEYSFATGAADHIKKWKFPRGEFVADFDDPNVVVNSMAINPDNVLVSAADNGYLHFYDWKTGYNFQRFKAPPQPGSLESESGIYAVGFDRSGSRLVTCEADKSIKMYKEDEEATEESHPVRWKPEIKRKRY